MKLYDFLSLDDDLQYQAVWDFGVHIDSVICDKIHYQLYAINDFYVEVHYDAFSNSIIGKQPFKQGDHLDKYLGQAPLP